MTTSDDNELARMYLEMEMYRERYEVLRRMTPIAFQELWQKSLSGNFDDLVDDLVKDKE
jgi:hypothetical protein